MQQRRAACGVDVLVLIVRYDSIEAAAAVPAAGAELLVLQPTNRSALR
jgi:hypothetical protein